MLRVGECKLKKCLENLASAYIKRAKNDLKMPKIWIFCVRITTRPLGGWAKGA